MQNSPVAKSIIRVEFLFTLHVAIEISLIGEIFHI